MRRRKSGLGALTSAVGVAALIAMLDVYGNMAATTLVTSMLATPHINPPPKAREEKRAETTPIALLLQLEWETGTPHDIDVVARCQTTAPNGEKVEITVNWLQVQQGWLRLSKDDLGQPTALNVEKLESTSETRFVPPNTTCWANTHVYHTKGGKMPLDARFIAVNQRDGSDEMLLADIKFQLQRPGEELTLLIVSWDKDSKPIKESIVRYPDAELRLIMSGGAPGGVRR